MYSLNIYTRSNMNDYLRFIYPWYYAYNQVALHFQFKHIVWHIIASSWCNDVFCFTGTSPGWWLQISKPIKPQGSDFLIIITCHFLTKASRYEMGTKVRYSILYTGCHRVCRDETSISRFYPCTNCTVHSPSYFEYVPQ